MGVHIGNKDFMITTEPKLFFKTYLFITPEKYKTTIQKTINSK